MQYAKDHDRTHMPAVYPCASQPLRIVEETLVLILRQAFAGSRYMQQALGHRTAPVGHVKDFRFRTMRCHFQLQALLAHCRWHVYTAITATAAIAAAAAIPATAQIEDA